MITGLKFLFRRGFRSKVINIVCAVLTVAMFVLVVLFHEPIGAEDYLICKTFSVFGMLMFVMLSGIFLCTDMVGNRAVYAVPMSKAMRLYSKPLYNTIVPFAIAAVSNIAYIVFVLVSGMDVCNISDALILTSVVCALVTISSTLGMNIMYGMFLMIYVYFPVAAMGFIIPGDVWEFGFGLPLWAAVLIYFAVIAAASGISFVIARLFWKYGNFKAMAQQNLTNT